MKPELGEKQNLAGGVPDFCYDTVDDFSIRVQWIFIMNPRDIATPTVCDSSLFGWLIDHSVGWLVGWLGVPSVSWLVGWWKHHLGW